MEKTADATWVWTRSALWSLCKNARARGHTLTQSHANTLHSTGRGPRARHVVTRARRAGRARAKR
eukprot:scaffold4967_cov116-Isochrysis_galbana.AAC.6